MNRASIWPGCLPLLLCALVVPALGSEPEWVEVRSPHFSVVTDAGEKRGRDAALHFEQMRAVYGALLVHAKVTLPTPLQIIAFRNTKEMQQFAPLWHGKPIEVAGLFQGNSDRCFILLDMAAAEPWRVVFHEYAHQLMNGNIPGELPPWFEEGFAEYFSTIKVVGKDAEVGLLADTDVQVLRQGGLIKVADLFRVQHDSSTYNESGDHRSVFYAESWLVMHYLYDRNLMAKAGSYLDASEQPGASVEQTIQQQFGMSAGDLNKDVERYWATGNWKFFRLPMPAGIESSGYVVKPLGIADAKAVLADAHLHSPDYRDSAIAEFQEVLKLQPNNAAALRGLGYASMMKQDFHQAGEYFTQAAEHDSDDPRVLYYAGLLAEREQGQNLGGDPAQVASIQKKLQKSVALDPEFADAYSLLAFTYMAQSNYKEASQAMQKAVDLNPRNQEYSLDLAHIYLADRKMDSAVAILQPLRSSNNQGVASRAQQLLQQANQMKQVMQGSAGPGNAAPMEIAANDRRAIVEPELVVPKESPAMHFLKGKVATVDCSAPPSATLTMIVSGKTWTLLVKDSGHVVVIGADNFSCAWKNQSVAVNFRASGDASGDIVSIEVQ
jgi:Flp pilus assembly protein TadD